MSTHLQRILPSGLSRIERLKLAVRAYWMGPISSSDPGAREFFGGSPTATGLDVNEFTALNYSAVFAAVGLIASQVGNLPLLLYRKSGDGKERFERHPLYRLVHDRPNPDMSAFVFRETLQAHVLTWGNGYAEIQRDGAGRPSALWPITPNRVTPFRRGSDAALQYRVVNPDGGDVFIPQGDMLHVPGHGFDGICGYSVVSKMRESIGLGMAAERFGGTFFGNGAQFGGVISVPSARPSELVVENDRKAINAKHQGVEKAHRFLMLYNGAKYERLGIPPNDAQFLETRIFQVAEIARWFNLPPHKLKELSRSTNNNIEHQNLEYYIDCLAPWLEKWEQELCEKLISPLERMQQSIEFVADGLLRGDAASRGEFHSKQFSVAMVTPNEGRKLENRNPLPGGDQAFVPLNMIPLALVDDWFKADIDSKKAEAEAKRRPPPTPVAPNAAPDPSKQRELDVLTDERDTARTLAQANEDAKDLALHDRDQIAIQIATLQTAHDALVAARATDRTGFSTQIETLRADLVTAQGLRDQTLAAKDVAEAGRSAAAVELARVQLLLETEQRDRSTERADAGRTIAERETALNAIRTERDAAHRATTATRTALADMTTARDAAVLVVTERTAERDALTLRIAGLSTQIEALSLDVTVAQRDHAEADTRATQAQTALEQMTAQATSLGTDLIAAQRDLVASVARAELIEGDYQRVCDEKRTLQTQATDIDGRLTAVTADLVASDTARRELQIAHDRVVGGLRTELAQTATALTAATVVERDLRHADDIAQAVIVELRTQVASLTAESTTLTAALADVKAQAGRAEEAKADALRQQVVAETRAVANDVTARTLTDRQVATQQAIRGVLVDAVQRGLVTRETDRARKQMTPDKLTKWVEAFYPMHEDVCRQVLRPAVKAWLVASGVELPVDALLDRVIPAYVGESTRAWRGLLAETDSESLPPALERVCRRWETERADALADRIMKDTA